MILLATIQRETLEGSNIGEFGKKPSISPKFAPSKVSLYTVFFAGEQIFILKTFTKQLSIICCTFVVVVIYVVNKWCVFMY